MEDNLHTFKMSVGGLIPVALLSWISAILGVIGLATFDSFLFEDMLTQMEIVSESVAQGSYVVFALIGLIMVAWPGLLAVCLTMTIAKRSGLSGLSKILDVCAKVTKILRYVFIGLFVIRAIRYTLLCLREDLVVYLIMAMILYEGLFGVAFYFFLQLLIKFFSNAADTLASLQYVLYSSKPEYSSSHLFVFRMLILLSLPGLGLAVYVFLYPFVAWPCMASLCLTASINVILGILLKRCESRISYAAYRLKKEQAQSER